MTAHYLIGVMLGILGGILTQSGQLLEKRAVNQVRKDAPQKGLMRQLIKKPIWVAGVVFGLGGGTAGYMLAQSMIGPALTPGLMASGLIVLAVGSVKMNGEKLNRSERLGIVIMVVGILCLGLSELSISEAQVRTTLADRNALVRIAFFTASFFLLATTSRLMAVRVLNRRGLLIALANGFLSCLSDFWINPFLALILLVLASQASSVQTGIFAFAASLLVFCATVITWQNQVAFKYAQASNIVPVAQVPIQIAPVLVYFFIFALTPQKPMSIFYILAGTILTIVAGFLLGRRQEVPIS
jgi:hypothetical protein